MRDFGKVHSAFWSSPTIAALSDDGRLLALYLMTCTHATIAGVFRLPDGYAAEDLRWDVPRVQKGFCELFANGFANRCETTKWVWVVKHLAWNQLENPNQRKAAAKVAATVPDGCAWKSTFLLECGPLVGLPASTACDPSGTVSKPLPNQEQEQEQEQEALTPSASSAKAPTPSCPVERIVEIYHESLPALPRAKLMNDGRKRAVRKLWAWVLTSSRSDGQPRATNGDEALDWIRQYFERASANDFLMGRKPMGSGHEGWKADLDFLLTEKGLKHVIEKTGVPA